FFPALSFIVEGTGVRLAECHINRPKEDAACVYENIVVARSRTVVSSNFARVVERHVELAARSEQQRLGKDPRLRNAVVQIDLAHEPASCVVDADRVGIAGSGPEAGDVKMAVGSPDDPIGPVELSRAAFVVDEDLGFSVAIEAEHGSAQAGGEIARRGIKESIR